MLAQQHLASIKRPPIKKLVLWQCLGLCLVSLMCWQGNKTAALSILLGGLVFIIPHAFFAWRSFMYMGAAKAQLVCRSFYRGQTTKFLLTAVMFTMIFTLIQPLNVFILFVSYITMAIVNFIAAALMLK